MAQMTTAEPKFAFIRFLEDNVKTTVEVADIKRFNPKNLDDFKPEKAYMVRWTNPAEGDVDSDDEDQMFFKAQILKLAATRAQLTELLGISRVRIPKVYDTSVEETEDEDLEFSSLVKAKKSKTKHTEKASTSSIRGITDARLAGKKATPLFRSPPGPANRKLIDDSGDDHAQLRKMLNLSQDESIKLKTKLSDTRAELQKYRDLNKRLQDSLLLKIETGSKDTKTGRPGQSRTVTHRPSSSVVLVDADVQQVESTPSSSSAHEEKDGKVHIGADTWLPKDRWATISNQTKHSMFVKSLLVAVWGTQTLREKSLEGKVCPRYKGDRAAKPPLSPYKVVAMKERFMDRLKKYSDEGEFSKFNKYVSEKLQDIHRAALKQEKEDASG